MWALGTLWLTMRKGQHFYGEREEHIGQRIYDVLGSIAAREAQRMQWKVPRAFQAQHPSGPRTTWRDAAPPAMPLLAFNPAERPRARDIVIG